MSQRAVEAALGRLICDDDFRCEFFEDPQRAVGNRGMVLTDVERASLADVSRVTIQRLAELLDERIRRASSDDSVSDPRDRREDPCVL